jgi:hypothetical protein
MLSASCTRRREWSFLSLHCTVCPASRPRVHRPHVDAERIRLSDLSRVTSIRTPHLRDSVSPPSIGERHGRHGGGRMMTMQPLSAFQSRVDGEGTSSDDDTHSGHVVGAAGTDSIEKQRITRKSSTSAAWARGEHTPRWESTDVTPTRHAPPRRIITRALSSCRASNSCPLPRDHRGARGPRSCPACSSWRCSSSAPSCIARVWSTRPPRQVHANYP